MILTILLLIGLTTVTSITALGIGLGSPGPMMFVLVSGVSNNIARSGAYSDAPLGNFTVPVVVAIGAIGSSLIVSAPLLLPTGRHRTMPRPPLQALLKYSHWDLTNRIIAYRVITSATIATLIAVPAGFDHAYWVVLVAGVVLQLTHSPRRTVIRVAHRMLGTIVGVGVFALIAQYLPTGIWLVVVLALFQGSIEIVVARNYGLALVFMTPLALTIATRSVSTPMRTVIAERLLDTLLGLGIALLVLLVSEWLIRRTTDTPGRLP